MAPQLSDDQIRLLRLRAQHLDTPLAGPTAAVGPLVTDLVGVQAQDQPAAALSVRVRCAGLAAADVELAQADQRSIVRTWCMRGTLHLVAAEDVGWLLALLGPIFIRASRRRRFELGLDDATAARGLDALREVLAASGPLTRAEIVDQLADRGIPLAGQARPYLLSLAALQAMICCGPNRGRDETYVLMHGWIDPGPALPPEQGRAALALRYLAAYAPASVHDFAAWSGLSLTEARAAWQQIAAQTVEVQTDSGPLSMLKAQEGWLGRPVLPGPVVRLLPSFDTFLLGYRQRDLHLAPEHARRINAGGGILHPAVLVDGRVAGTWKIKRRREGIDVDVQPFEPLGPGVQAGLEREAQDVGRFLATTATLHVAPPS